MGTLPLGARAAVTGAAGFIGARLVRRLVQSGCEVVAILRPGSDPWRLADVVDKVAIHRADLARDASELRTALQGIHVVFHLAAEGVSGRSRNAKMVEANVVGTQHLLEAAREQSVSRVVYCGSCFEYGSGADLSEDSPLAPVSEYGASKAAGWLLAYAAYRRQGLETVGLRPFTVYGPGEVPPRLVPSTVIGALADSEIPLTGGEQSRDFVFVDDVAEAFLNAGTTTGGVGEMFNLATGSATSVRDVVDMVVEITGGGRPRFGAYPYRAAENWTQSGSTAKAKRVLGWSATTPLHEGLRQTVQWIRDHRQSLVALGA